MGNREILQIVEMQNKKVKTRRGLYLTMGERIGDNDDSIFIVF